MSERIPTDDEVIAGDYTTEQFLATLEKLDEYQERVEALEQTRRAPDLQRLLAEAINRHSRESLSNTPDYVLASYLLSCLEAYECAIKERDFWNGRATREAPETRVVESSPHER